MNLKIMNNIIKNNIKNKFFNNNFNTMGNNLSKNYIYKSNLEITSPYKIQKTKYYKNNESKVTSFRMQEEYGPKKFIKP